MNVLRLLVPAACLALAAASCSAPEGEPAPGDLPMHGSAIEETGACAERTHETCAEGDGCRTLHAARYDEDRGCRHEAEPVGCMAADAGCGDALTHARDPAGNEWLFFDTCIPAGWQRFSESQAARDAALGPLCSEPKEEACADVPADACADAGCTALYAIRYDADAGCRHPSAAVGCMDADSVCGDALTYARDPAGGTWLFADTCIPKGWKHFLETQADRDAVDGPLCE